MAQHHGGGDGPVDEAMRKALRTALNTHLVGATGLFPDGQLTADDEGSLQFVLSERNNNVIVTFTRPVKWMGMKPQQAVAFAEALIAKARIVARKKGQVLTVSL